MPLPISNHLDIHSAANKNIKMIYSESYHVVARWEDPKPTSKVIIKYDHNSRENKSTSKP